MTIYNPGNIALCTLDDSIVYRVASQGLSENGKSRTWALSDGGFVAIDDADLRPVAVIDPEDDDQVKRLMRLLGFQADPPYGSHLSEVRTALRVIADPVQDAPILENDAPVMVTLEDPELRAMQAVVDALEPLSIAVRRRVMTWAVDRTRPNIFAGVRR